MKSILFIAMLLLVEVHADETNKLLPCSGELESSIEVIERVAPSYPTSPYKREHIDGWVELEVKVDSDGKATGIQIVNANPKRIYERSAKKALEKWTFSKSKDKTKRCGLITIEFKLED